MARRYAAMYVHPWDLVDEGPQNVLRKLLETGINTVNIGASYHSGRYLLPHNPKRTIFYAEEGVVYFAPHSDHYRSSRLKPRRSEAVETDVLRLVTANASDYGLDTSAWTVLFHNASLGRAHPEATMTNVVGDKEFNNLCPNHPDARTYALSMLDDLASNYELNSISLESASFPWGAYHGDHHEMFGVPVEPIMNELLSSCFCDHCVSKAGSWGIDLIEVKSVARKMLREALDSPTSADVPEEDRLRNYHALITGVPELTDLIRFKAMTTEEMIAQARARVRQASPRVKLHLIVQGVFHREVGVVSRVSEGVRLPILARHLDAVNVIVFVRDPQTVLYSVRWSKAEVGGTTRLIASLRPNYPIAYSPSVLLQEIENVFRGGADGIAFHSYGMTPISQFRVIREGLARQVGTGDRTRRFERDRKI